MSTLGKCADHAAERERPWRRSLAATEIKLHDAVRFAVVMLGDYGLSDDLARALALTALQLREWP
jgi:hypothetical protein